MSEPAAGGPRLPGLGGHCGQGAGHPGEQGRDQGRDQGLAQAPVRAPGRQVSADHGSLVTDHQQTLAHWSLIITFRSKRIDVVSRYLFPLVFAVFNVAYWTNYLIEVLNKLSFRILNISLQAKREFEALSKIGS